jgi:hypothetical protein
LDSSFMMIAATAGARDTKAAGSGSGGRATWQRIHSTGPCASKGRRPLNSSYNVTPSA